MKRCIECIMPDTRPRLTFDEMGVCAACEWGREKREQIDWQARGEEMRLLADEIRGKYKYDCIVPVSGGKDSTYVAHKMKHEYGLRVLTVTIAPPLETSIIQENLANFLSYGYENMKITLDPVISQRINKKGLVEQGRPLLSWTSSLNSVMLQLAAAFCVPLIMFGEEGEAEYGGTKKLRYTPYYGVEDAIGIYTYGNDPSRYREEFPGENLLLWEYPSLEEVKKANIRISHWSYFENWDPYRHFLFAQEHYGMRIREDRSVGTYTSFGQLDTPLYDLHTYLMYLKFGFGRCLQDACIDIRAGRVTRREAVEMARKYDGEYPERYVSAYLDYYGMTQGEFDAVLDRHANKELFAKTAGRWMPQFEIV